MNIFFDSCKQVDSFLDLNCTTPKNLLQLEHKYTGSPLRYTPTLDPHLGQTSGTFSPLSLI